MIRHKNTFNNWQPALFDGEFDWDFLLPAWIGTKIEPMDVDAQFTVSGNESSIEAGDIDAKVERNSHRLLFETKNKGVPVPVGQRITLENEWRIGATVFHVEGKTPESITGMAIYYEGKYSRNVKFGSKPIVPCDALDVLYQARCWFRWANNMDSQSRLDWDNELWLMDYARPEDKKWSAWCRDEIQRRVKLTTEV